MKILLDTHCLLWWLSEPEKLSKSAREIFLDPDQKLVISAALTWEVCVKAALGRLRLPKKPALLFDELFREEGFLALPIEIAHTVKTFDLPKHHSDPFDRLLIAQSVVEGMPLMTADKQIKKYKTSILWAL